MRRFGTLAVLALLGGGSVSTAAAQIAQGVPLYPVRGGTGISAMADIGFPEGGGKTYALTGGLGLGRIGVQATVGSADPDITNVDAELTYGAQAGMHLFGGGLNPIAIGVQAGYNRVEFGGVSSDFIPVGANVRFSPPLFPLKPYGVLYYDFGELEEVRVSVGADFNLILGLGLHAAYDWGDKGYTWGIGAHFNFRVPGM
jgi:hypothetical protein